MKKKRLNMLFSPTLQAKSRLLKSVFQFFALSPLIFITKKFTFWPKCLTTYA